MKALVSLSAWQSHLALQQYNWSEKQTEKCLFLVQTDVVKVFFWGDSLSQYIAEYSNIFKIAMLYHDKYRVNIVLWGLWWFPPLVTCEIRFAFSHSVWKGLYAHNTRQKLVTFDVSICNKNMHVVLVRQTQSSSRFNRPQMFKTGLFKNTFFTEILKSTNIFSCDTFFEHQIMWFWRLEKWLLKILFCHHRKTLYFCDLF